MKCLLSEEKSQQHPRTAPVSFSLMIHCEDNQNLNHLKLEMIFLWPCLVRIFHDSPNLNPKPVTLEVDFQLKK